MRRQALKEIPYGSLFLVKVNHFYELHVALGYDTRFWREHKSLGRNKMHRTEGFLTAWVPTHSETKEIVANLWLLAKRFSTYDYAFMTDEVSFSANGHEMCIRFAKSPTILDICLVANTLTDVLKEKRDA